MPGGHRALKAKFSALASNRCRSARPRVRIRAALGRCMGERPGCSQRSRRSLSCTPTSDTSAPDRPRRHPRAARADARRRANGAAEAQPALQARDRTAVPSPDRRHSRQHPPTPPSARGSTRGEPRLAQPARRPRLLRRQVPLGSPVQAVPGLQATRPARQGGDGRQDRPSAAVQVDGSLDRRAPGAAPPRSVREYIARAQQSQPGSVPQIVTLRHQGKKCHKGYSAGGASEDARTRKWYRDFARGVGNSRVVIGFEPDSLGTIDCLAGSRRMARLNLLRYGVDVLSKLPNATIYLEAGASDWEPAARTARQLRYIGISKVRGFMLNVTHYDWTAEQHQARLSTSRGAWAASRSSSPPPSTAAGRCTTAAGSTAEEHLAHRERVVPPAQARAWARLPPPTPPTRRWTPTSTSGGPGSPAAPATAGPLPVGSWFAARAVMFGRYATNWIRPPRGTRNGLPGQPLRQVAGRRPVQALSFMASSPAPRPRPARARARPDR